MKKIIVLVVFVAAVTSQPVFAAGEERVSREVRESFKKEFPGAEYAAWDMIKNERLYMVRFLYENQGFIAYFYPHGELVASARLITKEVLPYNIVRAMSKQYGNAIVLKIEELTMGSSVSYFLTLETEKSTIALRAYADGSIEKLRTRKKIHDKKQ